MDTAPTELQLAVLRTLWSHGEGTATETRDRLAATGRDLAPTTVATTLTRMEKQGLVAHRTQGRGFVYRAAVIEAEVQGSALQRLVKTVFAGDVPALVSRLIDASEVSDEELDAVKRLIANAKRQRGQQS